MTATIDTKHPMGAARFVRRERYAWPGGYPLALIMNDGALLCSDCVRENFCNISAAHRMELRDGWRPCCLTHTGEMEETAEEHCSHCGKRFFADSIQGDFENHAARAFFGSAWAEACEEAGESDRISMGADILDVMPQEIDPAAIHAARTLRMDFERENGCTVADALARIEAEADGDREATAEMFGHYCAMQAMGSGVGLSDAFGDVADAFTVPYVEFGSHSLARDYFGEGEDDA